MKTEIKKGQVLLRILVVASPLLLNDFYLHLVPEDAVALKLVFDIMVYIFWQSTIIYLAWQAGWFTVRDLGISGEKAGKQLLWGLALFIAVTIVSMMVSVASAAIERSFNVSISSLWYFPLPEWHPVYVFFYVLYLSITAGFYEEIVYRGIVIAQLRYVTSKPWVLILVSAVVFTLIHWSMGPGTWIIAFIFGAFWAWLFLRRGMLVPIMIAHFLYDFFSIYKIPENLLSRLGLM